MIHIVTGDPRPIFKQIVDAFRVKIVTGEIVEGTKLPSVRGLAIQLTVNTNTVAKAYSELTSLGLVEAQQGRGLFVAPRRQLFSDAEREKRLSDAVDAFANEIVGLDYSVGHVVDQIREKLRKMGGPDLEPPQTNDKQNPGYDSEHDKD
jgi:GntR family transcriptional regulator